VVVSGFVIGLNYATKARSSACVVITTPTLKKLGP